MTKKDDMHSDEAVSKESESTEKSKIEKSLLSIDGVESKIEKFRSVSDERLLDAIERFVERKSSISPITYLKHRDAECAINIVLNERGLIAPAYRPFRKLTKHNGLSIDEKVLGLDQQVLELHYLFENHKHRIHSSDKKYKSLFQADTFDYDLAMELATEVWRADTKVSSLNIPINIQHQLKKYCSKPERDHKRHIDRSLDGVRKDLIELSMEPRSRFSEQDVPVRVDEYRYLKLAHGSPSEAIRVMESVTGKKYDEDEFTSASKSISKRKKWLQKHLKISKW